MSVNANIVVSTYNEASIRVRPEAHQAANATVAVLEVIGNKDGGSVGILWPLYSSAEIEYALGFLEKLEASIDNLTSALRLRQQAAEAEEERQRAGGGAGASVEADRG